MGEQTKKRSMTTDDETETETEVRSRNTPAITEYRHRRREENEMKIFKIIITKRFKHTMSL